MLSFLFVLLAALGLGFLVFIHELGHYFAAKWVGIRVEAFSIGFGRPVVSWMRGDVQWRIGWLPFGGYVRMAGMDKQAGKQPWEVEGGFFAARPIDRIKVALAGPVVNLVFAFFVFTVIWVAGGRDKPFSELTHRVGWVDPHSELYQEGVRPGDEILAYDGRKVKTAQDHLYAAMLGGDQVEVEGYHINYRTGRKTQFDVEAKTYPHPFVADDGLMTVGILQPAQYLIYESDGQTGLKPGDRIVWADGQLLFSQGQLQEILNDGKVLLTIDREGEQKLVRVPTYRVGDLLVDGEIQDELADWHYAAGLRGRVKEALFIPYDVTPSGTVEAPIGLIDGKTTPLLRAGDRILAVDGNPITGSGDLMRQLQHHQISLIVQRKKFPVISWKEADANFDRDINWRAIAQLNSGESTTVGSYTRLPPITPTTFTDLATKDPAIAEQLATARSQIEAISDPETRRETLEDFEAGMNQKVLGVKLTDRTVSYNPPPTTQFANTVLEAGRTLKALVTGYLSPKFLSGPVGIVQVMHYGWTVGVKEALFWLGVISLNLGLLNLLPIPVLDGGHVCFSLWEMVTKRKIKAETMEKLVIPFVLLLIGFFIFATYQDLSRILKGFF